MLPNMPIRYYLRKPKNAILALDARTVPSYQTGMSYLAKARRNKGLSQAALAEQAGTSQPQIQRLEKGDREMTREWAERLAPILGLDPVTLLFGPRTARLVGFVGAGAEAHFYEAGDGLMEEVERPPGASDQTVALEIKGDSMYGVADHGWLVYYDEEPRAPDATMTGRLCVVGLDDGRVLIKRLVAGKLADRYDLESTNAPTMRDQVVRWASPVSWIRPR
ncbi:XRE family transcriptional regulator [Chelatococcus sp.]|uniref:XRE family transcriptional regulator n=1 Tax=Chelatococcus sp. TaxID=1953771 RepID=UPI001EC878BB|nr:XRE family transcriptional regulator [Chelatococcus sp.]MBX3543603.1 helix-turn-helix domain-containing protein [Chelatococcus sp.]